ncbi:beta-1,3-N-acetylglucosaminyltransferase lunatic fringe-like [Clavelina lepadiformis]|uniref:beta-1,3-N-acetylglucosaminyltransferase lunatic fringe-like n=1 Tax=Clavelina lepadiformis TaxID=159417 RepID=UPI00404126E7
MITKHTQALFAVLSFTGLVAFCLIAGKGLFPTKFKYSDLWIPSGVRYFQNETTSNANGQAVVSTKPWQHKINTTSARAPLSFEDVLITIKTTKKNHEGRINLLLDTWLKAALPQVYLVTDELDSLTSDKTNGHLVATKCGNTYFRDHLCCKTGTEFDVFLEKREKWWCHFDDDNYVNTERLVALLDNFNYSESFYIGKRSRYPKDYMTYKGHPYVFGTGGAGYCVTRVLAQLMAPSVSQGGLVKACQESNAADDCAIGYVVNYLLKVPLTESQLMHSSPNYVPEQSEIYKQDLPKQVSFHYGINLGLYKNETFKPLFNKTEDPTGFYSLHCILHPEDEICSKDNAS